MNRAQRRRAEMRRRLGLRGRVDADAVAAGLGLSVRPWSMEVQREFTMDHEIVVAERFNRAWQRWMIVHGICHHLFHPGNHLVLRRHNNLPQPWEREVEQFACALLVDAEAREVERSLDGRAHDRLGLDRHRRSRQSACSTTADIEPLQAGIRGSRP